MILKPRTLIDKLWEAHAVADLGDGVSLLHIDRIFLHERSGAVALRSLKAAGRTVCRPALAFATIDHIVDTETGRGDRTKFSGGSEFIRAMRNGAGDFGITFFDINDARQGITHVVAAEQGIALPGATMVCGDSHTCTLGGVGALAWGVGSSGIEQALATQTVEERRPQSMRIRCDGRLTADVFAKDLVLSLIGQFGASGGAGFAIEFAGSAVRALPIEARMTLCNMAVEFAGFTGIVAPDDQTIQYVQGRPYAPQGALWEQAIKYWHGLASDDDALFDRDLVVNVSSLAPQVTWGTSPQHVVSTDGAVPDPGSAANGLTDPAQRLSMEAALRYMDLTPGTRMGSIPIDAAFIGSCTNARLSDLREAAAVLRGRKVAPGVTALCVPGSTEVKRAAENEGLDRVFKDAGFEWRESGCSLCFYVGGDNFGGARRVISTTNRNFEGRQGPGVRSHLASPATVAASATLGRIGSMRDLNTP